MSRRCILPLVLLALGPAHAQIPDEFTNLKLLDPEIGKGELIGIMRDWSGGLGVRCSHCHVGPDDLRGMDFATDEKATKRTARRMLEMSRDLESRYLSGLPTVEEEGRDSAASISCFSCHRGLPRPPRTTFSELAFVAREGGTEAAIARFRELEVEHRDAGRYDFGSKPWLQLAETLFRTGDPNGARTALEFQLSRDPENVDAWLQLGRLELAAENVTAAREAFVRALELDPENAWGRTMLDRIDQTAGPADASR